MFNKSMEFFFSNCSFEIGCVIKGMEVITNTKFQLNICKIMPATPKQHSEKGCECHSENDPYV